MTARDTTRRGPLSATPGREGLAGTTPSNAYSPVRDPEQITRPPDGRPLHYQPQWRKDFPIDWPQDLYVARRDFTKFMVLTSFAFTVGQFWIAVQNWMRRHARKPEIKRIGSLTELAIGHSIVFHYPSENDNCILIRTGPGDARGESLFAYSQKCTHLSCAVVPKIDEGVILCPCHDGLFDLKTGRNIAGPPRRPLPRILLEIRGNDVYAMGVEWRAL